jgi:site-specific DNA-methyltransferase (cytosine-N4-specific)
MSQVLDALNSVDWDFGDAASSQNIHSIHPYPAKFIAQIPRGLIDLFHPGASTVVLDPFCGSGTTLVEAIDAGLDAIGIDLNPIACLISSVKTDPLAFDLGPLISDVVANAQRLFQAGPLTVPEIPRLDHWFKPDVQRALTAISGIIDKGADSAAKNALRLALSNIVVGVSNQESDTRYAAIEKNQLTELVFHRFERAARAINSAVWNFRTSLLRQVGKATVIRADVLKLKPADLPRKIGLVITSPPYPNAYEYWLYHKYRMYWLGFDPIPVRESEIGARPHYFKTNHQDETDFERQMSSCFNLLSHVMLPKAKACFLVGRSIIHGRMIDNVALLQRAAAPHGFAFEGSILRQIQLTRKAFNPKHSKINQEHIVVFSLIK